MLLISQIFVGSLLFIVMIAGCTRLMLVVVTIENYSMTPTFVPGDRVLVLRHWPRMWLHKGQVVIVWPWEISPDGPKPFGVLHPFIKRIIGIPGETLVTSITELDDFSRLHEAAEHDAEGHRVWKIPEGHIFVRGDHSIGGFDSLSWGPIPFHSVLGIVIKKLNYKPSTKQSTNV